jgi:hypothetical protein
MATRIARCAVAATAAFSLIGPVAHASVPRPIPTDLVLGTDSGLDQQESASDDTGTELDGIFELAAGRCTNSGGVTSGSYFRMIQPRGNPQDGPFITNSNSPCGDDTYTPMESGDDGGLATGAYQPNPEPAFDGAGNAQARGIFKPLNFQGIAYGGSTNEVDPQTGKDVAAPSFAVTSTGKLTGNVESVSVAWNNQHFNQGAPKPDGSTPARDFRHCDERLRVRVDQHDLRRTVRRFHRVVAPRRDVRSQRAALGSGFVRIQ